MLIAFMGTQESHFYTEPVVNISWFYMDPHPSYFLIFHIPDFTKTLVHLLVLIVFLKSQIIYVHTSAHIFIFSSTVLFYQLKICPHQVDNIWVIFLLLNLIRGLGQSDRWLWDYQHLLSQSGSIKAIETMVLNILPALTFPASNALVNELLLNKA